MVAKSNIESEYMSHAQTATEFSLVQSLLRERWMCPPSPPIIWCDNVSEISLAQNPVFHSRSKHVKLDVHFVRDKVLAKTIDIRYVVMKYKTLAFYFSLVGLLFFMYICGHCLGGNYCYSPSLFITSSMMV